MGLFAPWFLAALAGLALPLYLHLLKRQNIAPKPVTSLMLYESRPQSSTRHRRLRYFLLLVAAAAVAAAVDSRLRESIRESRHGRVCEQPSGAAGGRQFLQHACGNTAGRCQGRGDERAFGKGRRARTGRGVRLAIAADDASRSRIKPSCAPRCRRFSPAMATAISANWHASYARSRIRRARRSSFICSATCSAANWPRLFPTWRCPRT